MFTQTKRGELKPEKHVDAMIKMITTIWTNFAKFGNPNPKNANDQLNVEWKAVTKDILNYVNIDRELSTGVNPETERIAFWDSLYEDYPEAKYW